MWFLNSAAGLTEQIDRAFLIVLAIAIILFIGLTLTMVFFVVRYSRKRNTNPQDIPGNKVLEILWTIIPTVLALAIFYFGWGGFKTARHPPKDAMVVIVTARQWSYLFQYPNGKLSDVLNVPVGKPVKTLLHSQDVIHGFYIPAFKVKEDAVPGKEGFLWFVAPSTGAYDIMCTQYCGLRHSAMLSKVVAMAPEEFKTWYEIPGMMAKLPAAGKKGATPRDIEDMGTEIMKIRGCTACHSTDGSKIMGPTFKGLFGTRVSVTTGNLERSVVADEDYILNSILEPNSDVVKGFKPLMPSQKGLMSDGEIRAVTEYLKILK